MKKLIGITCLMAMLTAVPVYADSASVNKYPSNANKTFATADKFYEQLNRNEYTEFEEAKLNFRRSTSFKNLNKVLAETDQFGKARVGGDGYDPNRQVYVFRSIAEVDGKILTKTAVFDAETKRPIAKSQNIPR